MAGLNVGLLGFAGFAGGVRVLGFGRSDVGGGHSGLACLKLLVGAFSISGL
jgi:hypothetical protein